MDRSRIRIGPNTIDVAAYRRAADAARAHAGDVRSRWNLPEHFVLYADRLIKDKRVGDLIRALALLGDAAPALVVAGEGPPATTSLRLREFVASASYSSTT